MCFRVGGDSQQGVLGEGGIDDMVRNVLKHDNISEFAITMRKMANIDIVSEIIQSKNTVRTWVGIKSVFFPEKHFFVFLMVFIFDEN